MMRKDVPTINADATVAEFKRRFPLGSVRRVILLDDAGHYAGVVQTSRAYADTIKPGQLAASLAVNIEETLDPDMGIKLIMTAFDRTEADELAVVDANRTVVGSVSEAFATRRYAEELEKARRDLTGEA